MAEKQISTFSKMLNCSFIQNLVLMDFFADNLSRCLSVALCVSVQLSAVQVSVSGLLPLHLRQRCQLRQRQPSATPLPNGEGDPAPPRHGRLQWLRRKRGEPERKRLCSVFTVRDMNRFPLFSSAADQRRAARASAVGR